MGTLKETFNTEVPVEIENTLRRMLNGFRQDLKEHPYLEGKRWKWFGRRFLFPFHLPLVRFLLLTGMGVACAAVFITFIFDNQTTTWAEVEEQFHQIPYFSVSLYSGSPYTGGHHRVQYWMSRDGRTRIHSGDNISFVDLEGGRRRFRTYNVTTRGKSSPGHICKNILRSFDRVRQIGKPTIKSIIEAMSGENMIDTTSLVVSDVAVSKDLLIFDAESFDTLWNIRVWALRESKLPLRILKWHRRYDRYEEILFSYSKEQPKEFFDPDAIEEKIKDPAFTGHDLKYMFFEDPGRQSFSASGG